MYSEELRERGPDKDRFEPRPKGAFFRITALAEDHVNVPGEPGHAKIVPSL